MLSTQGNSNGYSGTGSGRTASVSNMGQGSPNDWGAILINGVHRYARLIVAVGAIIVLARYPLTRPLAVVIVVIALLSRSGILGNAMKNFFDGVFGGNN